MEEVTPGSSRAAILADIHGNYQAFEAVLEDIRKERIERIIVAGDAISDCPDSERVTTLIREGRIEMIRGNREEYLQRFDAGELSEWEGRDQVSALLWCFNSLSPANRRFLKRLPGHISTTIGAVPVRIVHGSPDHVSELLYEHRNRKRLREVLASVEEKVLICGHSHEQWHVELDGKVAMNPGSVGVHFNGSSTAEYAILTVGSGGSIAIDERLVPYDMEMLQRRFAETGMQTEAPVWSRCVMESLRSGENIAMSFLAYALDLERRRNGNPLARMVSDDVWNEAARSYFDAEH